MTPETIAELRKLLEKATPARWKCMHGYEGGWALEAIEAGGYAVIAQRADWSVRQKESAANGELIARLRNEAAALLSSWTRQREALHVVAEFLDKRFGNSDGIDWADDEAADVFDKVDDARYDGRTKRAAPATREGGGE